jgi:hypothetical protein
VIPPPPTKEETASQTINTGGGATMEASVRRSLSRVKVKYAEISIFC